MILFYIIIWYDLTLLIIWYDLTLLLFDMIDVTAQDNYYFWLVYKDMQGPTARNEGEFPRSIPEEGKLELTNQNLEILLQQ